MRFDENKAYPYPVLRAWSSDYSRAEFEVTLTPRRIAKTTAMQIGAVMELSDPDLLALVESKRAHYALLVHAPTTQHRSARTSFKKSFTARFSDGEIAKRVEARGVLVARQDLKAFRAKGWHGEYAEQTFDIPAGGVLAEDHPLVWEIDTAEEAPIGAIFYQQLREDLDDGQWACSLEEERVVLQLSANDHRRFNNARGSISSAADLAIVMNSVYLPALVHVLHMADHETENYNDRRWFRSLDALLLDRGRPELGEGSDRIDDAQGLLEKPFATLSLPADERA